MGQALSFDERVDDEEWNITADKFQSVLEEPAQNCTASIAISPLLRKAINHYRHELPPFLVKRANQPGSRKAPVPSRLVELAENRDLDPKNPRERKITFRRWDDTYGFWTLDLNRERFIVKAMGPPTLGRASYHLWLGFFYGFSPYAIAHSPLKAHAGKTVKNDKPVGNHFDGRITTPEVKSLVDGPLLTTGRPKRSAKTRAKEKIKATVEKILKTEIDLAQSDYSDDEVYVTSRHSSFEVPIFPKLTHLKPQPSLNGKNTDGQSLLRMDSSYKEFANDCQLPSRRREVFKTPESPTVVLGSKRTHDTFSATDPKDITPTSKRNCQSLFDDDLPNTGYVGEINRASTQAIRSPSGDSVGRLRRDFGQFTPPISPGNQVNRNIFIRVVDYTNQQLSSVEKTPPEILNNSHQTTDEVGARPDSVPKVSCAEDSSQVIPSLRTNHMFSITGTPQGIVTAVKAESDAEEPALVGNSSETPTQLALGKEPCLTDFLSSQKISNTSLLIAIPPNLDFKIVKLDSSTTVSDIATAILHPFQMEDKIDEVGSFRFKFEWLPANAPYRTLLIEPDQMSSSFDYVLKRIDEADMWGTKDECHLGVDILLKKAADQESTIDK